LHAAPWDQSGVDVKRSGSAWLVITMQMAPIAMGLTVLVSGLVGSPGVARAENPVARSYELEIEGMT
jgi:hypothetical protein